MRQSLARYSAPVSFVHAPSLADFITITPELEFSVHTRAIEGDWDPALIQSNTFEIEWPPRSGRRLTFPEIDRAAWFGIADARRKILKGQMVFVDRLLESAMAVCRDNR